MAWEADPTNKNHLIAGFPFKPLDDEEEKEFRHHGQVNDPPPSGNWVLYHPVIREEWEKRGFKANG